MSTLDPRTLSRLSLAAGLLGCLFLLTPASGCRSRSSSGASVAGQPREDQVEYKDGAVTVTSGENGAELRLGGAGLSMPDGWPAAFPLYPGARVSLSYQRTEEGGSRVVMLASSDPAEKLIEFYAQKAAAEGFVLASEKRSPGAWLQDYVTASRAFNIAVQDSASGVDVSLQLMEGRHNSLPAVAEIYWRGVDALPPDWPAERLPRLPGSTVEAAASMADAAGLKYRLQFTSPRPLEEVQAFYHDAAVACGLTPDPAGAGGPTAVYSGVAGQLELSCFTAAGGNKYLATYYASPASDER